MRPFASRLEAGHAGPIQVSDKTLKAMTRPMGHRTGDFKKLHGGVHPRLQELLGIAMMR